MTTWTAVLLASAACFAIKISGYLLPAHWLERDAVRALASRITIVMLSGLVAVQALASGRTLVLDARIPALAVAALLLWRRAPFAVVVAVAAATAAGLRALGVG